MIKPYVITQTQVKAYLSISDTTYDTQIDLYIPDVTDDLTRNNGICNQSFLYTGTADTAGTVTLSNVSLSSAQWACLYEGSCVYINGEDGVISSFDWTAETITLETALTETETDQELLIRNFPKGSKAIVSQMILSKIDGGTVAGVVKDITSESIGPVSVSYADTANGVYDNFGYPSNLTKALRTIRVPRYY